MSIVTRALLVAGLGVILVVGPFVCFRAAYTYEKRLREVDPGRVYRSGQIERRRVRRGRPPIQDSYRHQRPGRRARPGRREVLLGPRHRQGERAVQATRRSLRLDRAGPGAGEGLAPEPAVGHRRTSALLDDPDVYPVLIHCRAGLNRTGCLVAVYRMEYQGWSPMEAFQEMKDLGFGNSTCTASNQYVNQYVLTYRRGLRSDVGSQRSEVGSQRSE